MLETVRDTLLKEKNEVLSNVYTTTCELNKAKKKIEELQNDLDSYRQKLLLANAGDEVE